MQTNLSCRSAAASVPGPQLIEMRFIHPESQPNKTPPRSRAGVQRYARPVPVHACARLNSGSCRGRVAEKRMPLSPEPMSSSGSLARYTWPDGVVPAMDTDGGLWIATDRNSDKHTGRTEGLWALDSGGGAGNHQSVLPLFGALFSGRRTLRPGIHA
jgi:hypothetical protein